MTCLLRLCPCIPGFCFPRKKKLEIKDSRPSSVTETDADQGTLPKAQTGRADGGDAVSGPFNEDPFVDETIREESQHNLIDAGPVVSSLSRTDRMFRDRLEDEDEDDMASACHRLNVAISNCTQWVVDDWSQIRHPLDPNEERQGELSRLDSQNPTSGEVLLAIGGAMLGRIRSARAVPSTTELEMSWS